MNQLRRWATPLVAGSFALVAVTGVLMFFEAASGLAREVHEWASLLLVVASAVHLLVNARGLGVALRPWAARLAVAAFVALTVATVIPGVAKDQGHEGGRYGGGPPERRAAEALLGASLSDLGAVLARSPEELRLQLEQSGLQVRGERSSLRDIAQANARDPRAVLHAVLR